MGLADQSAVAEMYQAYGHALYRRCLHLLGSPPAARALLQAAFCRYVENPPRFVRERRRFNVLHRLATELSLDNLRQQAARATMAATQATVEFMRSIEGLEEDVFLARYLAEELSWSRRYDVEQDLTKNPALQVRLAVLRSERAAFYAADPPEQFAERVVSQANKRVLSPLRRVWPFVVAAFVGLCLTLAWFRLPWREGIARLDGIRSKRQMVATVPPPPEVPATLPVSAPPRPTEDKPAALPPLVAPASRAVVAAKQLIATFDFGEELGRVSVFEGRSKQKTLPAGSHLQVRAQMPEDGFAAVFTFDLETKALKALTGLLEVKAGWRALSRLTVERPQRLYLYFSADKAPLPAKIDAQGKLEGGERQAQIELTLEPVAD